MKALLAGRGLDLDLHRLRNGVQAYRRGNFLLTGLQRLLFLSSDVQSTGTDLFNLTE